MKALIAIALLAAPVAACKDKQAPPREPPPTPAPPMPADPPASQEPSMEPTTKPNAEMPPAAQIAPLVTANNNFGLELWRYAGEGNTAISPLSISTALAMTWAGAKGKTAAEMQKAMRMEGATDALVAQWGQIAAALQDPSRPFELQIANRLFGDAQYQFESAYLTLTQQVFGAPLESVDFRGASEAARAKINVWVEQQTRQRIKNLLPPGTVDSDTRIVLVNAIYFLADWANPFNTAQTFDADFKLSASKSKRVPMMHKQDAFKLAKADGAALLELPYKSHRAAMYILLPDAIDGLPALERDLPAKLHALQSKLATETVLVSLPRFVIEPAAPLALKGPLQKLGMRDAFDQHAADLTGIANPPAPSDRLFIGEVLHKAFVKVDEKGTEAAAATAVIAPRGGPPPKATPFNADHPFLFVIVERSTGLILFIGRVVDPAS